MYNPVHFREVRPDVLHAFIRAHPLGTLVTSGQDGPEASHLPIFLDADAGRLRCHMARSNPQWRQLETGGRALAIFTDADRIQELRATPGGQLDGHGLAVAGGAPAALQGEEYSILIEELELGVRSYNCLKRVGVETIGDLISKTEGELSAIPNFGKKSIEEVKENLATHGLSLRSDDD